jgi:ketosteroid isomerase-like protein
MKLRIISMLALVIGLSAAYCAKGYAKGQELTGEAKMLAQIDDAWSASAGKRDLELLVSFYADDAVAYPPGGNAAMGRAAIRAVWAGITDPNYSLSWKANSAGVSHGGELGYTAGTFVESTKGADGKTTTMTGKFLCVWRKQLDGHWKAIHDMWNYDAK